VVTLPTEYAIKSILKVIYPIYGRVRDNLERTKLLVDEALMLTTGFLWPFLALVAGASPVIISVLLGPRWDAAVPLLPLFALAACGIVPSWLLTNAAQAFGWMRIIAARQIAIFAGAVATLATVHLLDLGLNWLLVGVAASQWASYALTLQPFIRRRFLDGGSVLRTQLVHGAVAAIAYGAAATCAHFLDGAALPAQVASQAAVGVTLLVAMVLARPWIPAMQILTRRIGATPDQSIGRVRLAALLGPVGLGRTLGEELRK
jgi:O-antigen/teichoic acid export membrane protein